MRREEEEKRKQAEAELNKEMGLDDLDMDFDDDIVDENPEVEEIEVDPNDEQMNMDVRETIKGAKKGSWKYTKEKLKETFGPNFKMSPEFQQ